MWFWQTKGATDGLGLGASPQLDNAQAATRMHPPGCHLLFASADVKSVVPAIGVRITHLRRRAEPHGRDAASGPSGVVRRRAITADVAKAPHMTSVPRRPCYACLREVALRVEPPDHRTLKGPTNTVTSNSPPGATSLGVGAAIATHLAGAGVSIDPTSRSFAGPFA